MTTFMRLDLIRKNMVETDKVLELAQSKSETTAAFIAEAAIRIEKILTELKALYETGDKDDG